MVVAQFVHVGDVHLKHGSSRNPAKLAALEQILAEGLALPHLAGWLIPGDLFDTRSTVDDRNVWASVLTRMAAAAPVAITPGNHDAPGDLDIFAKLRAAWSVYVQTVPGMLFMDTPQGLTAAIGVLPYPTRAGLVSAGVAKGDVVATAEELLAGLLVHIGIELTAAAARVEIPLFMAHVNIAGSRASRAGQPQIGHEIELSGRVLEQVPAVYRALNHIHLAQEIGGGVYAGSIAPANWGETEIKAYNVVTCTLDRERWSAAWEARRIHTAPLYHVDGVLTREAFTWTVTDGPGGDLQTAPSTWRGSELRVRYKFAQSEKSALSAARVLAEFAEADRLEVEPVAVPDRSVRAPEVAAAHTLAEKLAAYQQMPTLPTSLAEKLTSLEHDDATTLLARVQSRLADTAMQTSEVAA